MGTEMEREAVLEAVQAAVDRLNEQMPPDEKLGTTPDTMLYGDGGPLDSLGLVNLIVLTEEAVLERLGQTIALGDQVLSEDVNPFADVGTLVDHLLGLLPS